MSSPPSGGLGGQGAKLTGQLSRCRLSSGGAGAFLISNCLVMTGPPTVLNYPPLAEPGVQPSRNFTCYVLAGRSLVHPGRTLKADPQGSSHTVND